MAHRRAVKAVVPFAVRPVLVVVGSKCALELAVAARYGWHREVRRILRDETDGYDAVVEAEWMMGPPITGYTE